MKVIYIGTCNALASNLVDRFVKQGEEMYLVSEQGFSKQSKPTLPYKLYHYQSDDLGLNKVFASVKPDLVIFAGTQYLQETWNYDHTTNRYMAELLNVLNQSNLHHVRKFIYLSSSEVYPGGIRGMSEEDTQEPSTYKGLLCAQAETMVTEFRQLYPIDTVILRMGSIYGCSFIEKEQDFLSNMVEGFYLEGSYHANTDKVIYPLHVKDCVDAILRAKDITPSSSYNVGFTEGIRESRIANLLHDSLNQQVQVTEYDGDMISFALDSSKIKAELEWVCFHSIESVLSNQEIDFNKAEETLKKRRINSNTNLLSYIENMGVFLIFASIMFLAKDHLILSTVDLMFIYIIMTALLLGVRQSFLAILLSAVYYLLSHGIQIYNVINILTNVEFMLRIAQYIFMGATVGYAVDHYRTSLNEKTTEYEYLNKEYQEIVEINDDNIMIKQEYEKRLLNSRNSLPKLYSIIAKLTVLEPERIFTEAVSVIQDIMETDTVAVYLANDKSSYIRLINYSNADAVFQGKSIDLNQYPDMRDKLRKGEVYVGTQWDEELPSLATPILLEDTCIAVIIIKHMKFSMLNLHNINLLRTLTLLITSSIIKAKRYEEASRDTKYIPDTDICTEEEFNNLIHMKSESKAKGLTDYCILRLPVIDNRFDTYYRVANLFRNTDFFGTNEQQELFVLLGNTPFDHVGYVLDRLKEKDVVAQVVEWV